MLPVQYILFSDCGSGPIKSVHKRDPLAVAVPAVAYHNLKIKVEPQNVTRGRHMGIPERNPGQEQMCRSRFGSVRIHLYSLSHGPVIHQSPKPSDMSFLIISWACAYGSWCGLSACGPIGI